jgi:hypothetical protein
MPKNIKNNFERMTKKNPCVELICIHCEFFKEDDIELECAAFKVLKSMLKSGKISQEEIRDALG